MPFVIGRLQGRQCLAASDAQRMKTRLAVVGRIQERPKGLAVALAFERVFVFGFDPLAARDRGAHQQRYDEQNHIGRIRINRPKLRFINAYSNYVP